MTIDCTLDALMLPGLATYQNEFGTKKLSGGLQTSECADDAMLPFRKMRPYEVSEDSETSEIQHNAVFIMKTAETTLTLHDGPSDFLGCEARIINTSSGEVYVKGGVSGLDGGTGSITIQAKKEKRLVWLSDGWHSQNTDYLRIDTADIADSAITNDKIADSTIDFKKLVAQTAFDVQWPVGVTYVQYPQQASPNDLWGTYSTWEEIDYDGAFFRASGGNASDFIEESGDLSKQEQSIESHSHSFTPEGSVPGFTLGVVARWRNRQDGDSGVTVTQVISHGDFGGGGGKAGLYDKIVYSPAFTGTTANTDNSGSIENRPENYTIKIWKRTA